MLYRMLCAVAIVCLLQYATVAQSISTLIGARANSLAYSSACLQDEWSLFNNVAGLASVDKLNAIATFDWQPSLPVGNRMAAAFILPTKAGTFGAGLFRFGDDVYNEQMATIGFANTFGIASLGLKVNYIQYTIEGFGSKGMATVSFGGIAALTPSLKIGAHIININQPNLSAVEKEKLPTTLILGVAFNPSEKILITTEVEKDISYDPLWKVALEYQPFTKVAFRTGFNIHPNTAFFGVGFKGRRIKLDYAFQFADITGIGNQASIGYQFGK